MSITAPSKDIREIAMVVRTTIHLDEKLLDRVRRVLPQRGLSLFVYEAVVEKMSVLERQQIE